MRLNAQRSKLGSCGRTKIQPDANLKKSEANDEQGLFRSCRDATRVLSLEPDAVRIVAALAARSVEGAVSGEPRRALRSALEGSAPARRRRGPHLAEWMKPRARADAAHLRTGSRPLFRRSSDPSGLHSQLDRRLWKRRSPQRCVDRRPYLDGFKS